MMGELPSQIFMLPLEEIALRRLAVNLWNESDTLALIAEIHLESCNSDRIWRETSGKVLDKASKLLIPESFRKQIVEMLRPIGMQIRKWKRFHEIYLTDSREDLNVPILELLIWTSIGTIDYKRTAEEIVRYDLLDIVKRYKLACLYCLDNYIPMLWKKLPGQIKRYFQDEERYSLMEEPHLEFCWPYILKGEQSKLDNMPGRLSISNQTTFNQFAFEYSAFKGNKSAAEYFFQKLTQEEKDISLPQAIEGVIANRSNKLYKYNDDFPKEKLSDVLYYLISVLTSEQQMKLFQEQIWEIFPCFFDWSWQNYFLHITEIAWTLIPRKHYHSLVNSISTISKNSGYVPKLFQQFFLRSPSLFKDEFLDAECVFGYFFTEAFKVQDSETITVIFKNISLEWRWLLVSCVVFFDEFDNLIMEGKWHLVEMVLREATLSSEEKEELKNIYRKNLAQKGSFQSLKKWERFFPLLDEIYGSTSKRSSEIKTLTNKKLCCEE